MAINDLRLNDLRHELGLPILDQEEIAGYQRRLRAQNRTRSDLGMPPLPLVLAELRQRMSDARVEAFISQHAPLSGHRDALSLSGCLSYDSAISAGCGDDERISKPRP